MRSFILAVLSTAALTIPVLAAAPAAPSNLTATATSATTIRLDWVDNSSDEAGFEVSYRVGVSGSFIILGNLAENRVSVILSATRGTTYQFQIRSFLQPGPEYSVYDGPATVTTPPAVTSASYKNGKVQQSFSFNLISSSASEVTGYEISSLPLGLDLNAATGAITGTPTIGGRTDAEITIHHSTLPDAKGSLRFEIFINPPALLPPAIVAPLSDLVLTAGTTAVALSAGGVFTDPDVTSAARLTTDPGPIDFVFYPNAAPQTVANFLGYLDRGDFINTMFHRSVPGFIIQGGAFRADATASAVPTQAPVVNEPRVTNLAGTVAMAKVSGNPDSATNQFFISLADNADILDPQNEGFTVFARVAGNGMSVANAIATLPIQNFETTNSALKTTPVRISPPPTGPVPYDPTQLVRISAANRIEPLSLAVTSSDPTIATATLSENDVLVTPLSAGIVTITLTATDLDAQATASSFQLTVTDDSYDLWSARQSFLLPKDALPDADPDHDGLTNLVEYALASEPKTSSPAAVSPSLQQGHLAGGFSVRRFLSDTTVSLETSETLAGPWTKRWNLADGFIHPWIVDHVDAADSTFINFLDPNPAPAERLFLRLKVTGP